MLDAFTVRPASETREGDWLKSITGRVTLNKQTCFRLEGHPAVCCPALLTVFFSIKWVANKPCIPCTLRGYKKTEKQEAVAILKSRYEPRVGKTPQD